MQHDAKTICGSNVLNVVDGYDYDQELEIYSVQCSNCLFTHINKYSTVSSRDLKSGKYYKIYQFDTFEFNSIEEALHDWECYISSLTDKELLYKSILEFILYTHSEVYRRYDELEEEYLLNLISNFVSVER